MNVSRFILPLFATSLLIGGCAHHETSAPAEAPTQNITSAPLPPPVVQTQQADSNLSLSDDLAKQCNIDFGSTDRAPKFDFDSSDLSSNDSNVLDQVAKCVTTGPLRGKSIKLVGRADPRGETEYNMALGEHRAASVGTYLENLGVDKSKIAASSRGKLDATGTDETSWAIDRRVDISLDQ